TYFVGCPEWGFDVWAHNAYAEFEAMVKERRLNIDPAEVWRKAGGTVQPTATNADVNKLNQRLLAEQRAGEIGGVERVAAVAAGDLRPSANPVETARAIHATVENLAQLGTALRGPGGFAPENVAALGEFRVRVGEGGEIKLEGGNIRFSQNAQGDA